jgi:hypothetical protein
MDATNANQTTEGRNDNLAEDLLIGGKAIRDFLVKQGLSPKLDIYHKKKTKEITGIPIGKMGPGQSAPLAASKKSLLNYLRKMIAA